MFEFRVRRLVYPFATGAGPDYSTFILFQVEVPPAWREGLGSHYVLTRMTQNACVLMVVVQQKTSLHRLRFGEDTTARHPTFSIFLFH